MRPISARRRVLGVSALGLAALMVATAGADAVPARNGFAQGSVVAGDSWVNLTQATVLTPQIDAAVAAALTDRTLGRATSLSSLLADRTTVASPRSGGTLRWKAGCGKYDDVLKRLDKKKRLGAWCWQGIDETSVTWVPQGVGSTSESSASGKYDGQKAVAVSWYRRTTASNSSVASRISFFRTPSAKTSPHYNHVTLVEPVLDGYGRLDLSEVRAHAGGLAWSGPYLFVPDTASGVRVFDVRRIYRVANGVGVGAAVPGGVLNGAGARYAMLEVARYYQSDRSGCLKRSVTPICFSTLSIDRSTAPARLVASEFMSRTTMSTLGRGAAVVSWSLGSDGLPVTRQAANSTTRVAVPIASLENHTHSAQGTAVTTSTKDIYTSSSTPTDGWFYWERRGDGRAPRKTSEWPVGAESLSHWYGPDKLWSVTELVRKRTVFWVYSCEMRGGSKTCR